MIIKNPHNEDVSVTFMGTSYTVLAGGSVEVPTSVGAFWISIHPFLSASESEAAVSYADKSEDAAPAAEEDAAPAEAADEVAEEATAEEAPKPARRSRASK